MNLLNLLLYSGSTGEGGSGFGSSSYIFLILMLVVFYFFFIRPQLKRTKDQRNFREALKKGDKIKTIGGIHGKVMDVKETTVIIEIEGQNRLKLDKSAIALDSADQEKVTRQS